MPIPSDDQLTDTSAEPGGRRLRADAQRSADLLVAAARDLFATKGIDATTREIAERAGVGVGTLFRRFPRRADLVAAVFREELDACADAAATLARDNPPFEALAKWMQLYVDLIATKRGLAQAVSSDDPVYVGMAARFDQKLRPAVGMLTEAAMAAGVMRPGYDAAEIFAAVSALCLSQYEESPDHPGRMVALLLAGLRVTDDAG